MKGIRALRRAALVDSHVREREENGIDPDDGNSWSCSACKLPIFSTPFIKSYTNYKDDDNDNNNNSNDDNNNKVLFLHDQCANLPKELKGSVLHPGQPLFLRENPLPHYCVNCKALCGTIFYDCPDPSCDFQLDVLCALTTSIKILHRSHEHRLMAVPAGSASYICGACGTRHDQAPLSDLLYMCSACCFWIHPYCASLPNVIILQHANQQHHHHHPLVLNYRFSESFESDSSRQDQDLCFCAICKSLIQSLGLYSCTKCRYYVHIMCAVLDRQSFKPVLIREARLPDLISLPIPDEHTSVIRYITNNASIGDTSSSDHHDDLLPTELHEHPLIFHDEHDDNDDSHPSYLCDACVQSISPPFYSCSECPNFFLHDCCAHLPRTLTQHPAHKKHPLSLFPKAANISQFFCKFCKRRCNGFSYSCRACNFNLDVLCALMPASITHDAHSKTHILYSTVIFKIQTELCHCCGHILRGICYECRTCRNFALHSRCALLPNTISHKFDQHPLKLTTTISKWRPLSRSSQQLQQLSEICETGIHSGRWYYSCYECDQSFHTDCIPRLDFFSKIKLGVTIKVQCHDCALTLIQEITVLGYRCGYCQETFWAHYGLVFECSKCYFRIHENCAEKCLVKNVD